MRTRCIIVGLALFGLAACGRREDPPRRNPAPPPGQSVAQPLPTMTTTGYSDGQKWKNGVDVTKPTNFFISTKKGTPPPIRVGHRLRFAAAGEGVVKRVFPYQKENQTLYFIEIDRSLDPLRDGCPNAFVIVGELRSPHNYSEPPEWKNGVSLTTPGLFFITQGLDEAIPFKVGDRLRFAASGVATVLSVTPQRKDKYQGVFIKVDKPIDPVADGFPNTFEQIR